jgi:hypothetical protein
MRAVAILALTSAGLSLSSLGAEAAPWCAQYSGARGGATNCAFYSFNQCQQTVRGIGGFCNPNPFETYGYQQRRRSYGYPAYYSYGYYAPRRYYRRGYYERRYAW